MHKKSLAMFTSIGNKIMMAKVTSLMEELKKSKKEE